MRILTIGRNPGNNILLNNNTVSRNHAQITILDNGQLILKDLGSSNGTYINGTRINENYLKHGDRINCGNEMVNWEQFISPHYNQMQTVHLQSNQPQHFGHPPHPQGNYQQNVIVIGKQKSVGVAFILAFLFGPLGLLYASVMGGIIMFFVSILVFVLIPIIGPILSWIGCIIWAVMAADNVNKTAINQYSR